MPWTPRFGIRPIDFEKIRRQLEETFQEKFGDENKLNFNLISVFDTQIVLLDPDDEGSATSLAIHDILKKNKIRHIDFEGEDGCPLDITNWREP